MRLEEEAGSWGLAMGFTVQDIRWSGVGASADMGRGVLGRKARLPVR